MTRLMCIHPSVPTTDEGARKALDAKRKQVVERYMPKSGWLDSASHRPRYLEWVSQQGAGDSEYA